MTRLFAAPLAPLALALALAGCGSAQVDPDAGLPDGAPAELDARPADDGGPDAGGLDRGGDPPDREPADAGPADAASADAGPADAASADAAPDADPPDQGPPSTLCASSYAQPRASGHLDDRDLVEISGLAPSATRAGVFWGHTDSGGDPRLYAIDSAGALRGSVGLPFENQDFEDIAAAPCPDQSGPCLWIADTGDNRLARQTVTVYAVAEPVIVGGDIARAWTYPLAYPQGPVDSEALAVSPDGRTIYLFEKVDGPVARVYGITDPVDGEVGALTELTRFSAPGFAIDNGRSITGADLHPTGERLLIRVYTGSYEYRFAPGQGPADLSAIMPLTVGLGPLAEPQGEAICYGHDGRTVWTVSEDPEGEGGQPLHRYDCRD